MVLTGLDAQRRADFYAELWRVAVNVELPRRVSRLLGGLPAYGLIASTVERAIASASKALLSAAGYEPSGEPLRDLLAVIGRREVAELLAGTGLRGFEVEASPGRVVFTASPCPNLEEAGPLVVAVYAGMVAGFLDAMGVEVHCVHPDTARFVHSGYAVYGEVLPGGACRVTVEERSVEEAAGAHGVLARGEPEILPTQAAPGSK